MLGLQTWMNASVSASAHKTIGGKTIRTGDRETRCRGPDPNRLLSDPSCRGTAGWGLFLPAHGPHAAPVQQFQRSHADPTAAKSVMKTRGRRCARGTVDPRVSGHRSTPGLSPKPGQSRACSGVPTARGPVQPKAAPGGLQEAARPPLTSHFPPPYTHTRTHTHTQSLCAAQVRMSTETINLPAEE